jgi:hypothetical protein
LLAENDSFLLSPLSFSLILLCIWLGLVRFITTKLIYHQINGVIFGEIKYSTLWRTLFLSLKNSSSIATPIFCPRSC